MSNQLKIQLGQYSHQGRKAENQDFYGATIPTGHLCQQKGIACAIADGISSSNVSHIASETAVASFLSDYFSTPESWTVKTSAERVINATNSWLYSQTQQSQGRFDKDRGYVCTLSAVILKADQAHIFHIGDSRVYRLQNGQLEQLTADHRIWFSSTESYLSRALGVNQKVEIDYQHCTVYPEDIFILMTDGVYEYLHRDILFSAAQSDADLAQLAKNMVDFAYQQGSQDNLTIQIIKVCQVAQATSQYLTPQYQDLAFAPQLSVGDIFEGYQIRQILHHNHRSSLYLAHDQTADALLVMKTPSIELRENQILLEQFFLEEWVSKRLQSPYLLAAYPHVQSKNYIYHTLQYIQGQSLASWLQQQPQALSINQVVAIIEQVAKGLNALHRMEMLHQDIRPENIMIDEQQKITLIDFGSTVVKGIVEFQPQYADLPLGTLAYMAPEYFIDELATVRSEQYSLAVMTYYLLCQHLPYNTDVAKCRNKKQLQALSYQSIQIYRPDIPIWVDAALEKALKLDSNKRYEALSEFIYDLKHPNPVFMHKQKVALLAKNPVLFWQLMSMILLLIVVFLLCK